MHSQIRNHTQCAMFNNKICTSNPNLDCWLKATHSAQCGMCFGQSANCTQCPGIARPSNLQPPLHFSFHCLHCVHCTVYSALCTQVYTVCKQCIFHCFHCVVCIMHMCLAQCGGYCILCHFCTITFENRAYKLYKYGGYDRLSKLWNPSMLAEQSW